MANVFLSRSVFETIGKFTFLVVPYKSNIESGPRFAYMKKNKVS